MSNQYHSTSNNNEGGEPQQSATSSPNGAPQQQHPLQRFHTQNPLPQYHLQHQAAGHEFSSSTNRHPVGRGQSVPSPSSVSSTAAHFGQHVNGIHSASTSPAATDHFEEPSATTSASGGGDAAGMHHHPHQLNQYSTHYHLEPLSSSSHHHHHQSLLGNSGSRNGAPPHPPQQQNFLPTPTEPTAAAVVANLPTAQSSGPSSQTQSLSSTTLKSSSPALRAIEIGQQQEDVLNHLEELERSGQLGTPPPAGAAAVFGGGAGTNVGGGGGVQNRHSTQNIDVLGNQHVVSRSEVREGTAASPPTVESMTQYAAGMPPPGPPPLGGNHHHHHNHPGAAAATTTTTADAEQFLGASRTSKRSHTSGGTNNHSSSHSGHTHTSIDPSLRRLSIIEYVHDDQNLPQSASGSAKRHVMKMKELLALLAGNHAAALNTATDPVLKYKPLHEYDNVESIARMMESRFETLDPLQLLELCKELHRGIVNVIVHTQRTMYHALGGGGGGGQTQTNVAQNNVPQQLASQEYQFPVFEEPSAAGVGAAGMSMECSTPNQTFRSGVTDFMEREPTFISIYEGKGPNGALKRQVVSSHHHPNIVFNTEVSGGGGGDEDTPPFGVTPLTALTQIGAAHDRTASGEGTSSSTNSSVNVCSVAPSGGTLTATGPTEDPLGGVGDNTSQASTSSAIHYTHEAAKTVDAVGMKVVNQYTFLKELGRGRYGKVKLAITDQDKLVAVKVVPHSYIHDHHLQQRRESEESAAGGDGNTNKMATSFASATADEADEDQSALEREVRVMSKLKHRNIVRLREVIDDPNAKNMYLVMSYCERGPLMNMTPNGGCTPLQFDVAKGYMKQLLNGLQYLHNHNVIHRDIKPDNILLGSNGIVHFSDFGVSSFFKTPATKFNHCEGTPTFHAPEICEGGHRFLGPPTDVWALGVTFYCMIYGRLPFFGDTHGQLREQIIHNALRFPRLVDRRRSITNGGQRTVQGALADAMSTSVCSFEESMFRTSGVFAGDSYSGSMTLGGDDHNEGENDDDDDDDDLEEENSRSVSLQGGDITMEVEMGQKEGGTSPDGGAPTSDENGAFPQVTRKVRRKRHFVQQLNGGSLEEHFELQELLNHMLDKNPETRFTVRQCRHHTFFKKDQHEARVGNAARIRAMKEDGILGLNSSVDRGTGRKQRKQLRELSEGGALSNVVPPAAVMGGDSSQSAAAKMANVPSSPPQHPHINIAMENVGPAIESSVTCVTPLEPKEGSVLGTGANSSEIVSPANISGHFSETHQHQHQRQQHVQAHHHHHHLHQYGAQPYPPNMSFSPTTTNPSTSSANTMPSFFEVTPMSSNQDPNTPLAHAETIAMIGKDVGSPPPPSGSGGVHGGSESHVPQ